MFKNLISFFQQHKILTIGLAISWTIIIIVGCSLPGNELPKVNVFDNFDKVVHFTFFAVFFILWKMAFYNVKNASLIIILIAFVFGYAIEFYQLNFVAGRSFDIWDGISDTIGSCLGFLFYNKINKLPLFNLQ